ncbi:hypothetical protein BDA96_10G017500 [Sorghum bicolor]|nr:hypothetical protein BDA96_10G017500 [Sorghum bicolor]
MVYKEIHGRNYWFLPSSIQDETETYAGNKVLQLSCKLLVPPKQHIR